MKLDGLVFFSAACWASSSSARPFPGTGVLGTDGFPGPITIPEWLGLGYGVVVFLVVLMALGMLRGPSGSRPASGRAYRPRSWGDLPGAMSFSAATALLLLAGGLALYSQAVPDPARPRLLRQAEAQIASRERHIEPAELLSLMRNNQTVLVMLDVRGESDYNLFHLVDAHMVSPNQIRGDWARGLPADAIKVVMSNGEEPANQAAQELMARGIRNVYILDGGINHWLDTFGASTAPRIETGNSEALCYAFPSALGARYAASNPDRWNTPEPAFTPKVKLEQGRQGKGWLRRIRIREKMN